LTLCDLANFLVGLYVNLYNNAQQSLKQLESEARVVAVAEVNPLPHGDANRHTIFKRKN